ncbi:MAG: DMT family transporter [Bacteroidales bacterium]|nr:DMT family transporter [Bacteroidales bacterium]
MADKLRTKAHFSLLGASFIFGANYSIAKGLMPDYMMPLQIILLRVIGASLLFWMASIFTKYERIEWKDLGLITICAMLGVAANQIFFFMGLNLTSPVDASIIHTSSPIIVLVLSSFILKEKITGLKIFGIILGATGALTLIVYGQQVDLSSSSLEGNLLVLLNISAYSLYLILAKPLMNKYQPITVMKWLFLISVIFVAPFSVHKMDGIEWSSFSPAIWASLLYVIIGNTFFAYLLIIFAIKQLTSTIAAYYIYLQPVVATVIAIMMFNEKLTLLKIIAAALIFTGVFLVNRKSKQMANRNQ